MAAAAPTSMAAIVILIHRLPAAKPSAVFCHLPQRPSPSSTPFKILNEPSRSSELLVKATSLDESSFDTNELLTDLKQKWDAVENKSTVIIYGGGAIVAVWLASTVVGAVNSVPLGGSSEKLPKIMELVGLGYTGWFVYRYLLFKSSRNELAGDIEAIKKKIAGTE